MVPSENLVFYEGSGVYFSCFSRPPKRETTCFTWFQPWNTLKNDHPETTTRQPSPGPKPCLERKRKAEAEKIVVSTVRLLVCCVLLVAQRCCKLFSGGCRWLGGGASCFSVGSVAPRWCKLFSREARARALRALAGRFPSRRGGPMVNPLAPRCCKLFSGGCRWPRFGSPGGHFGPPGASWGSFWVSWGSFWLS